ncbi:NACHT domain-containing protein [Frankia sp. R43]|uniref:NACHT domain-containing protein n=1 Tax=Frankia sp. R43 TaxID=269536 RepID=UPI001F1EA0AF|nr:NACHT domain-containing protein [Frankia sp. R43]
MIWLTAGAAAVLAGAVAWPAGQGGWAAVLVAAGVLLTVLPILLDREASRAGDLDIKMVADRLAAAVRKQWADEAKRREITSPPLAVSWRPVNPSLVQPWTYLQQLAGDGAGWPTTTATAAGPQDLAGSGPQILTTYDRTPCGRLVVLGEPGAGKTVLLLRLVLDLLARRQDGEPVPLLVPLASWNPDGQNLNDWLESQILRTYPDLTGSISAGGKSRARALLDDGLIVPILDGLDEIRGGSRAQALVKINATLGNHTGMVLSSRVKAFRNAVRPRPGVGPIRLEGAAGVHLDPIAPHAVADYLIATAGEGGQTRWAAVRTAVTSPGTPLARTLVTPLMASLARTIYNPRDGESTIGLPNPADLATLQTRAAIEQHLIAGFVPAAYRPHPHQSTHWNAEQATGYLSFLARHLEHRLRTTSLAWWELPRATSRSLPIMTVWSAVALAFTVAVGLTSGLTAGLAGGFVSGFPATLSFAVAEGQGGYSRHLVTLRRLRLAEMAAVLAAGLFAGVTIGAMVGVRGGIGGGIGVGLVCGLGVGCVTQLVETFAPFANADVSRAADPGSLLAQDRTSGLASMLIAGLAAGFAAASIAGFAAAPGFTMGPAARLTFALAFGLVVGLVVALASAWGRLGLARLWLATRRQQPLHLIAFLEDAHARGVLRQAGAVWEFRHSSLQRYLAGPP